MTPPESPLTDAVMALDLKTGKVLWAHRAVEKDLFMGGCAGAERSEACPEPMGPDYDIGNSPILVTLERQARIVCRHEGRGCRGADPDENGQVLFRVNPVGPAGRLQRTRARRDCLGRRGRQRQRVLRHGRGGSWRGSIT